MKPFFNQSWWHKTAWEETGLATVCAVLVGVAYWLLPDQLTIGPNWIVLPIEGVFLAPLGYSLFVRPLSRPLVRRLRRGLQGMLALALAGAVILLVTTLPQVTQAGQLVRPGVLLWVSNILICAQWYWEIDGGGLHQRAERAPGPGDFLFPQQSMGHDWRPSFVDYLFVAFCFATAFSPADTSPLTHRAKLLMMAEALISLLVQGVVIARSINIIH